MDLAVLRELDLEGLPVLRVLPGYGEAVGIVSEKLQVVCLCLGGFGGGGGYEGI